MKTKKQIAIALRSKLEAKHGVPIFLTKNWTMRAAAIAKRVLMQQTHAHDRALQRKWAREEALKSK